jgi:hypothetical protein
MQVLCKGDMILEKAGTFQHPISMAIPQWCIQRLGIIPGINIHVSRWEGKEYSKGKRCKPRFFTHQHLNYFMRIILLHISLAAGTPPGQS